LYRNSAAELLPISSFPSDLKELLYISLYNGTCVYRKVESQINNYFLYFFSLLRMTTFFFSQIKNISSNKVYFSLLLLYALWFVFIVCFWSLCLHVSEAGRMYKCTYNVLYFFTFKKFNIWFGYENTLKSKKWFDIII